MKKFHLLIACLGLPLLALAQVAPPSTKPNHAQGLPVVRAQAQNPGQRHVNWQKPKAEDDGPDCWILCECSDTPQTAEASSTLNNQGKNHYSASRLLDDDPTTAWVEGQPDHGIGTAITLTMSTGSLGLRWRFLNGYQKNPTTWEDNARIKKLKMLVNGQPVCTIELLDLMGDQDFRLDTLIDTERYPTDECVVTLIIEEVYPGRKYKDTALSAIYFGGC
jgi:hypothetical protein